MIRGLSRLPWALLLWALLQGPAWAGCTITGIQAVVPASFNVGNYTSTSIPPPVSIAATIIVRIQGNGIGSCQGNYGFVRSSAPAQMTRTPPSGVPLPYNVMMGSTPVLTYGAIATALQPIPGISAPNGSATVSFTVPLTVMPLPVSGAPPAGSYSDTVTLQVFDTRGNNNVLAGQLGIAVTATVVNSCYLAAPSGITLNFSADVAAGMPAGNVQTTSFGVNCTGPARISLTGSALSKTPAISGTGVFDAMINFRAVANFAGASTTLVTNGLTPVTATSVAASTITGVAVPVNLNVNLIANRPLIGGSPYIGVLRVIVDPVL